MSKRELIWGFIVILVILAAYFIPYTVLTDVAKWYGGFFLWVVVGIVVIIINMIITKDWRS